MFKRIRYVNPIKVCLQENGKLATCIGLILIIATIAMMLFAISTNWWALLPGNGILLFTEGRVVLKYATIIY